MSAFRDKLRSIAAPRRVGQSRVHPKRNEETGRVGGYEREHWDGSRDAVVKPEAVRWGFGRKEDR